MQKKSLLYHLISTTTIILVLCSSTVSKEASKETKIIFDENFLGSLKWRCIGPANPGGRIDDFAVAESDPDIIYMAAASGGVWKTTSNGTTWEPIFDVQTNSTIGDVTVSSSHPDIVWVGSGEANNRQSSSWGDGVYKSTDGGKTWKNMGLNDTHHIGRIVIHPIDPDVVYVAALGHLWGPNKERGLFKTIDGGKTWINVLYIDENTGVVDVAMDLENPGTLYAATYQRQRRGWGFSGGGPGSGLYKSTDGGESWVELTDGEHGLPAGMIGRIGIDIYRGDPRIVYTIVEHKQGGVFRSEDKGLTWKKMSSTNPRPVYYSQIRVDPNNDQRVWVLGAAMYFSEDGGRSWDKDLIARAARERRAVHGDHHAMWINPSNSDHIIIGSDGGVYLSYDRGKTWDYIDTLPLGQVYEISFDMRKPYYISCGLQDNGTWHGPSAAWFRPKITNDEWFKIGGADGFYSQVDPTDHTAIYTEAQNGDIFRLNLSTGEYKSIKPESKDPSEVYRFNWNAPFLLSPHDPHAIYLGGNKLFISKNRGETWEETTDLTSKRDREKLPLMGVLPDKEMLSRHDGIDFYGDITTISESPLKQGLLYVGTDDGNLQVSRDGGQTWKNVIDRVPGVPKQTYVSRVMTSHHEEGTAYATLDGHRNDDFRPYVFMTTNYGESWQDISSNIPSGGTVNVIREHHRNPRLLFVGTERGAYFSINRGRKWVKFKNDFPIVPVDDIAVHPRDNDLIFGTHGRSVWILDDITPLEQLTEKVLEAPCYLFDIRPATIYNFFSRRAHYDFKGLFGHKVFRAPNPPYGAIISYYLKEKEDEEVTVIIKDGAGQQVRKLVGTKNQGINRIAWDLRYGFSANPPPAKPGMNTGPSVLPGKYTVTLMASGEEITKSVQVELDPKIDTSWDELRIRHDALISIYRSNPLISALSKSSEAIKKDLEELIEILKQIAEVPPTIQQRIEAILDETDDIRTRLLGNQEASPERRHSIRGQLSRVARSVESYTESPTEQQLEKIQKYSEDIKALVKKFNIIIERKVLELNTLLNENNIPRIIKGKAVHQ